MTSSTNKDAAATLIAEQILFGLRTQTFFDWYNSDFEKFIEDSESSITEEDILKRIKSLFRLH
jgi:hypothetical protein